MLHDEFSYFTYRRYYYRWLGSLFVKGDMPGGIIGSMIAGLIGAWIGHGLLGTWGPHLAGFAIIPAVIGAAIVVFLVSLLTRKRG